MLGNYTTISSAGVVSCIRMYWNKSTSFLSSELNVMKRVLKSLHCLHFSHSAADLQAIWSTQLGDLEIVQGDLPSIIFPHFNSETFTKPVFPSNWARIICTLVNSGSARESLRWQFRADVHVDRPVAVWLLVIWAEPRSEEANQLMYGLLLTQCSASLYTPSLVQAVRYESFELGMRSPLQLHNAKSEFGIEEQLELQILRSLNHSYASTGNR